MPICKTCFGKNKFDRECDPAIPPCPDCKAKQEELKPCPKKNGWYLAYDGEWDRMLYKDGRWFAQTKTRKIGYLTDVFSRDDVTQFVTAWKELPDSPEQEKQNE